MRVFKNMVIRKKWFPKGGVRRVGQLLIVMIRNWSTQYHEIDKVKTLYMRLVKEYSGPSEGIRIL